MGKAKKTKVGGEKSVRHAPLAEHILEDKTVRPLGRSKDRMRNDGDEDFVDDKLSKRILQTARQQQEELEEEHGFKGGESSKEKTAKTVRLGAGTSADSGSEDEDDQRSDGDEYEEIIEIDEADEKAMEIFMNKNPPIKRTLADIIMEKITEKQTEIQSQMSDAHSVQMEQVDDRIVAMYRQIGEILSKYRSGKIPKAFKIVPSLRNWEQILYLTDPEKWTAAAVHQATRLFASNLNAKMAQRYFNLVLLPRIQDDIAEYKRLNFHLYMAIRKALFKPAAFFKGVLLPLCESGQCTLREAVILSSILAKVSIPMLHSAATIIKIAEMDYNGANSIFLRTLLDKKYALPFRVIDAVIFHFTRFVTDKRDLPVLWHQALLTFVQRYKQDISSEQKDALFELLRAHSHESITPEVRRELINSKCRDAEDATPKDDDMGE